MDKLHVGGTAYNFVAGKDPQLGRLRRADQRSRRCNEFERHVRVRLGGRGDLGWE